MASSDANGSSNTTATTASAGNPYRIANLTEEPPSEKKTIAEKLTADRELEHVTERVTIAHYESAAEDVRFAPLDVARAHS